jgi:hypothetical protein
MVHNRSENFFQITSSLFRNSSSREIISSDISTFQNLTSLPLFVFLYFFYLPKKEGNTFGLVNQHNQLFKTFSNNLSLHFFSDPLNGFTTSNLHPLVSFKKYISRKLLKLFKFHRFSKNVTMWYYNMLIRFLEFCTGKKIYLKLNPFLENYVTFADLARCAV